MFPVLHIFGFHIPMYSLMTFLGVVAYAVTYYCIIERGKNLDRVSSNRFIFVSILGVIALYVFAYLFNSLYHSIEQGEIVFGGITWLGGVVGCVPVMLLGIHFLVPKAKGNAVELFSLVIPGLVLGHAFGRMGCFFGGMLFRRSYRRTVRCGFSGRQPCGASVPRRKRCKFAALSDATL